MLDGLWKGCAQQDNLAPLQRFVERNGLVELDYLPHGSAAEADKLA